MSSELRDKIVASYNQTIKEIFSDTALTRLKPNYISYIGVVIGLVSACFFGFGYTLLAGFFLLLSGLFDTFDGLVARINNKSSKFGALLDSSLDRYVEFMVFFGILIYYRNNWMFYVAFMALVGSIMVSYTRARAEGLGGSKIVGILQRPERIILLSLAAIINEPINNLLNGSDIILSITLITIAILSNITAIQRIIALKQQDSND